MPSAIAHDSDIQAQARLLALFISDLHLEPARPETTQCFLNFLKEWAAHADKLYILGDLFEAWAGDDELAEDYYKSVVQAIHAVSLQGCQVFWVPGNRDFLTGPDFASAAGVTLLEEPAECVLAGLRLVVLHGDAQCTDDIPYMNFRAMVRQPAWQQQFLSLPLENRRKMVADARKKSQSAQQGKAAYELADVNAQAIDQVFERTAAEIMIHGHTHRPKSHEHTVAGRKCLRMVLPDWELDESPQRGGWLGLDAKGCLRRYDFSGRVLETFSPLIQVPRSPIV